MKKPSNEAERKGCADERKEEVVPIGANEIRVRMTPTTIKPTPSPESARNRIPNKRRKIPVTKSVKGAKEREGRGEYRLQEG